MKSYITDITRCFCDYRYYQDNKVDDDFLYHLREQKDTSEHTDFDSFSDMKIENCMCRLVNNKKRNMSYYRRSACN